MPSGMVLELQQFFVCAFWGMLSVVYYDFFRILRFMIHHSTWMVAVEDMLFSFGVGCLILAVSYSSFQGQLRGYLFAGMLCGAITYNYGISPFLRGMLLFYYRKMKEVLKKITKRSTMNRKDKVKEGSHD
jgi:hypothetical protein